MHIFIIILDITSVGMLLRFWLLCQWRFTGSAVPAWLLYTSDDAAVTGPHKVALDLQKVSLLSVNYRIEYAILINFIDRTDIEETKKVIPVWIVIV